MDFFITFNFILIHFIFYKIIVKDKFGKYKQLYDHKAILLCSVIVLIAMVVMIFTYKSVMIRYSLILVLIFISVWKRKQVMEILNSIKKA